MMYLAPKQWRQRCAQVKLLRADARARGRVGVRWVVAALQLTLGTAAEGTAYYLGVLTAVFTALQAALTPDRSFDPWVRDAVSYAAPAALCFGLATLLLCAAAVTWQSARRPS